jgi:hypothetical protein
MISKTLVLVAVFLMSAPYVTSQKDNDPIHPKTVGFVPDSATAIKVAKEAMQISDPAPRAELRNGIWIVMGRACCHHKNKNLTCEPGSCLGGGERIVIRQNDGEVLSEEVFR